MRGMWWSYPSDGNLAVAAAVAAAGKAGARGSRSTATWEQRRATNRQQSVRQCLCGYDAEIVLGVGGDWLTADARRGRSWMLPGCGKWRVHTPQGPKGEGPDRGRFDDLGQIKKNDGIVARLGWKSVRDVCVVTTADF